MKLQQKEYYLIADNLDNKEFNIQDIKLKLNENLTSVSLNQLFLEISDKSIDFKNKLVKITGWSVLQNLKDSKLKIKDEEILISFYENSDNFIHLNKVKNPWFILNDKKISDEEFLEFENKIYELSRVYETQDDESEEVVQPSTSVLFENKRYENSSKLFIGKGYEEFKFENFRLLKKDDKLIFIELLSNDLLVQHKNEEKVIDNFWKYNEDEIFNVKLIDNQLEVSVNNNVEVKENIEIEQIEEKDLDL